MDNTFDAIVIGAGSVGVPCALFLSEEKFKVLVLESGASPGQGQNKAAIGGIRATHSDSSKIRTCLRSIEIFSTWKENYGDEINWRQGGYAFPAYTGSDERMMKDLLLVQKKFGLDIDWISPADMARLVPGINPEGLRGGTLAPGDGNASPLLAANAFYRRASALGAVFRFGEKVTGLIVEGGKIKGVSTPGGRCFAPAVINAAGADAAEICSLAGAVIPVDPDCHEAGITEPAARMFDPMIVDIRPGPGSQNCYFYQNHEGQVVFCLTPAPPVYGRERGSTSSFLPAISKRLIQLLPRLAGIKVRRVWRGLYPMTPDGVPIIDALESPAGLFIAAGMCGQGFMLGPGTGELVSKMVSGGVTAEERAILDGFRLKRKYEGMEKFR